MFVGKEFATGAADSALLAATPPLYGLACSHTSTLWCCMHPHTYGLAFTHTPMPSCGGVGPPLDKTLPENAPTPGSSVAGEGVVAAGPTAALVAASPPALSSASRRSRLAPPLLELPAPVPAAASSIEGCEETRGVTACPVALSRDASRAIDAIEGGVKVDAVEARC